MSDPDYEFISETLRKIDRMPDVLVSQFMSLLEPSYTDIHQRIPRYEVHGFPSVGPFLLLVSVCYFRLR
jgi:hypothetical protein